MSKHDWVTEVLSDLEMYMLAHDGRRSRAALDFARHIAAEELGLNTGDRCAPANDTPTQGTSLRRVGGGA